MAPNGSGLVYYKRMRRVTSVDLYTLNALVIVRLSTVQPVTACQVGLMTMIIDLPAA